ncbi:MAG: M48 family metalloprotease [Candidatus Zixiibacteriota bacterium]|nr:MAG: M48 family metalloprotease [candidate division Zixibacteria bacterium]
MSNKRALLTVTLLVVLPLFLLSCATTGPGGKQSFILIPTGQEVAIGAGMAEQVEQQEKVFADTIWQNYLNNVGQKIAVVCDRKDIEYHFKVIESDQINAFAAPGGYIYFYTGLLREMENEAEMAAVMAHEISHVVGRHGIKRLQTTLGVAAAYQLVFGEEGASDVLNVAIGIGMNLMFADYSRDNEREADEYGIHYMVQAGYHPDGAIGMFEKLAALGGGGEHNVFEKLASTHPATQERIRNAKTQIAGMQPLPADVTLGEAKYRQMLGRIPAKK